MSAPAEGPYKGLVPYTEEDKDYFFGREREIALITANLMAHRLTLLYGVSGAGKSSVLNAGVAPRLREEAERSRARWGNADFAVVVLGAWRDDPLRALEAEVRRSAARLLPEGVEAPPPGGSLVRVLEAWAERLDGELLVILDQFEEYFLYHDQEAIARGSFARELAQAINHPTLKARFLISLREDALARLDAFKGIIPRLFDNYLRVGHLQPGQAREAVVRPVERYSELHPEHRVTIEPALVDAVLEEVGRSQLSLTERGAGEVRDARVAAGTQIETPDLQLVMMRLWREEMRLKSTKLRLQTFRKLGGAQRITDRHLDEVMYALPRAHREAAWRLFRHLVTKNDTKIAHSAETLAELSRLPQARVEQTLERLSAAGARVLRKVEGRYQIYHDVMGRSVLDWRQKHRAARKERNRLVFSLGGAALLVLLMYGVVVWPAERRAAAERTAQAEVLLTQHARELRARRYADEVLTGSGMATKGNGVPDVIFEVIEPGDYAVQLVCVGGCRGATLNATVEGDTAPVAFGSTAISSAGEARDTSFAGSALELIGPSRGRYALKLSPECGAGSCPWAYGVYRREPLPDSATVLITAVDRASAAVQQARRTLDTRPLAAAWQGAALRAEAAVVDSLRRQGVYEESHLLSQEFCALSVDANRVTARADVIETWRVAKRRVQDDSLAGPAKTEASMQPVSLRWSDGGWRVDSIGFEGERRC